MRTTLAASLMGGLFLCALLALPTTDDAQAEPAADEAGNTPGQLPPDVLTFLYTIHNNGYIEPCG